MTKRRTHFELRAALRETDIAQARLARALDVSPITVWRWVNGKIVIPGYVWAVLALLDKDKPERILNGMAKKWMVEYEDVFTKGETYRQMAKRYHPDMTGKDTNLELAVISEFKNF